MLPCYQVIHYSPYRDRTPVRRRDINLTDGSTVFPGPLCTDNGFWDTFRTVYPLLSLVFPDYLGDIIQGVNDIRIGMLLYLELDIRKFEK